jgi:hypothetical protein
MAPSASRRRPLVLTGEAPQDCVLRITSGTVLLSERHLAAKARTRIEFPGTEKAITLHFDRFINGGGRKLAFLVEYTNCFSEDEIRW